MPTAETTQTQQGDAHVDYQILLPESKYLTFDSQRVSFVEATLHDDVHSNCRATHVFLTADPDFLTTLKAAMTNADPVLSFRIGFGTAQNTYWLPWQTHLITLSYAKFEGIGNAAGHRLVIHSENTLTRLRRSKRVLTRKGTLSAMAAAIAQAAGMESVVEETDGSFMLVQSFTDDVTFLLQRVLPRAVNKNGNAGYLCFVRDNVLHFHTMDYQTTAKQVDYYSDLGVDFEASDLSQSPALWQSGISGVNVIAQDPATGDAKQVPSDPTKVTKLADGIYSFANVAGGNANLLYHLGYNPVVELNALAQSAYQRSRRQTFKSLLTLQKIISIRHGDLLNVSVAQQDYKSSTAAGSYLVTATLYSIHKGQVISVYTLERGETQPQRGVTSVQSSENQLTPVTEAPGHSPNLASVQSSEQTRGAGDAGSASTFTTVSDPQTGAAD